MSKIDESIVLVGGGGGVYRVARFLKHIRWNISTIQTTFDHGRHSGQLRDERGMLPPGDIRQAILALANETLESTMKILMSHRFKSKGDSSLNGTTVGNIMLTALTEELGSLPMAIDALCKLCGVRGKVLPVSLDNSELCVRLSDGIALVREDLIDNRSIDDDRYITQAFLRPNANLYIGAYDALVNADKIVLCPGDLYTSLIPNLLVEGFNEAVFKSKAKIIYVLNIMTKKAETHGYEVADFIRTVSQYLYGNRIDVAIYNSDPIDDEIAKRYAEEKAYPVQYKKCCDKFVNKILPCSLVDSQGGVVRHHERIASIIAEL